MKNAPVQMTIAQPRQAKLDPGAPKMDCSGLIPGHLYSSHDIREREPAKVAEGNDPNDPPGVSSKFGAVPA